MFRSEEMARCQLFIQQEAAFASVSLLGEASLVEFRDLNRDASAFTRKFIGEVRRCEELERKLRFVEDEMSKDGVVPSRAGGASGAAGSPSEPRALNPRSIIELEANLEKTENEIVELNRNAVNLKSSFVELTEMKQVLEKAQIFLAELEELPGKVFVGEDRGSLGVITGVIPRGRVAAFETMLWRISRGNVLVRQAVLEDLVRDPATGDEVHKSVFVVFFQGENLRSAVRKVCSGFRATVYPCPATASERVDMVRDLRVRLQDLILILEQTRLHRQRVLAAVRKELLDWRVLVIKTKGIYHTLNMFDMDVTKKCLIGECWVPVRDLPALRHVLLQGGNAVGSNIPSFLNVIPAVVQPPTYIPTNKFTAGFQALSDAYCVASYREVNPAVFYIVTFPFLFAVMFGDLGHGLLMTLFALVLVVKEDSLASTTRGSEIMTIFFNGRYVILLMGVFSMYTGLMYNDLFSVSVALFPSSWGSAIRLEADPARDFAGPYPIGLDPVWQLAANKIIFLNSFKMKLSIIIGVAHMIFGVCLSVANHITRRRPILILLEVVPQLLFLGALFGYLAALMMFKWWKYRPTTDPDDLTTSPGCAPSVLVAFINMMLRSEPEPLVTDRGTCSSAWLFDGQEAAERVLLYTALLCVPVLLLAKPLYLLYTQTPPSAEQEAARRRARDGGIVGLDFSEDASVNQDDAETDSGDPLVLTADADQHQDADEEARAAAEVRDTEAALEEPEPFGEVMVHQAIHTVEYVLSTVSHTASYLRLWALSLAHSQLSHVLWSMVLRPGLRMPYWMVLPLPALFAAWAMFTVAILVLMEGLSAFLHTLRLHWVEFMSKFYQGEGYPFQPFSFRAALQTTG